MAAIHYKFDGERPAADVIVGGPTVQAIKQAVASGREFIVTTHLNGRRVIAAAGNRGALSFVRNDVP